MLLVSSSVAQKLRVINCKKVELESTPFLANQVFKFEKIRLTKVFKNSEQVKK